MYQKLNFDLYPALFTYSLVELYRILFEKSSDFKYDKVSNLLIL